MRTTPLILMLVVLACSQHTTTITTTPQTCKRGEEMLLHRKTFKHYYIYNGTIDSTITITRKQTSYGRNILISTEELKYDLRETRTLIYQNIIFNILAANSNTVTFTYSIKQE